MKGATRDVEVTQDGLRAAATDRQSWLICSTSWLPKRRQDRRMPPSCWCGRSMSWRWRDQPSVAWSSTRPTSKTLAKTCLSRRGHPIIPRRGTLHDLAGKDRSVQGDRSPRRKRDEAQLDETEPGDAVRISSMLASRTDLQEVLAALPDHYRHAVVLRNVRQLPYNEVARRLEINLNTAKSRVARGRALLAAMLPEH
jgi:hypothetical protein